MEVGCPLFLCKNLPNQGFARNELLTRQVVRALTISNMEKMPTFENKLGCLIPNIMKF